MINGISFIVLCNNSEKTISHCIDAINAEAKRYWTLQYEIILVDAGCTDKTIDIALRYNHAAPTRVVKSPASPANEPAEHNYLAMGQKVSKYPTNVCINADIIIPQNYLATVSDIFIKNPDAIVITGPRAMQRDWIEWLKFKYHFYKAAYFKPEIIPWNFVVKKGSHKRKSTRGLIIMTEAIAVEQYIPRRVSELIFD